MKPSKSIIECAIENARLSKSKFRTGAVIYYKNSVEGEGYNIANKTHPKSPHAYKVIDAEFAAIIDAVRHNFSSNNLRYYSIYVHRLLRNDTPALAKPCTYCAKLIDWIGIRPEDVYFSI